ncbi:MAG: hypothetical protein Kow0026_19650 [Oricola sp.]
MQDKDAEEDKETAMTTLVKITQDGRRLEVIGLAICLDKQLVAFELMEVALHPNRRAILEVLPEATHMAGRVALTAEEAAIATEALARAEADILASPAAIGERFRLAVQRRQRAEGIE